jgi:hypothetical protein
MNQKLQFSLIALTFICKLSAQITTPTIKEEADVPSYQLPQLLISEKGIEIDSPAKWERLRRPEILSYFANHVYGVVPDQLDFYKLEVLDDEPAALEGKALRKQVNLTFKKEKKSVTMSLLIYLPKGKTKSPVFLAYNFNGNYRVNADPDILINGKKEIELSDEKLKKFNKNKRGRNASRWAYRKND